MKNIYVSNLSFGITNDDLKKVFDQYGEVMSAKVIVDQYTGKSRGFGFVEMRNNEEADKAIEELNLASLDGKEMSVAVARPKTDKKTSFGGNDRQGGGSGGYNRNRY